MIVARTIQELKNALQQLRRDGAELNLVPTMGVLHEGHLSLIKEAKSHSGVTAVTIFVNPLQFNNSEDLKHYPVTTEQDLQLCEKEGVELLFMPEREEMYPAELPVITFSVASGLGNLCAPGRPGHFEGVLLIVARLFNLFQPTRAFFGKKDYQQLTFIKRMVSELNYLLEIVPVETVRAEDGLALSSRNLRLKEKEREHATLIYRALRLGEKSFRESNPDTDELVEIVKDVIESGSLNRVEYVEVVQPETLEPIAQLNGRERILIAVAVSVGDVRLIDNIECER